MNQKRIILQGAFILTLAGFASRIIGFFYRIFLSHTIGAEGVGIYQLLFPIYAMAFSLTSAGIQTAISRNVSGKIALHDKRGARDVFFAGLLLSLGSALLVSYLLSTQAGWISSYLLQEVRCEPLVKLLAYALPFASIHSSISGYYFGLKRTNVPAISQMIEQVVRVSSSYLIYLVLLEKGMKVTPLLAVIGLICEEAVSSLFSITAVFFHFKKYHFPASPILLLKPGKSILTLSIPLTANRVLLNLLQSVEAILIPVKLQLAGLSNAAALSVYGVLTGMALPLILFPSAITVSLSIMLLPAISEAQASGNDHRIAYTVESTIQYSLILGILCTGIFLCFGNEIGELLFHEKLAGTFIVILGWICPFLYLGTTLSSIINGLGKTMTSFLHNAFSLGIRILFVWFALPVFGITGYLWGVLVSQLVIAALALHTLHKQLSFHFDSTNWILKPLVALALSAGIMYFFRFMIFFLNWNIPPLLEMIFSAMLISGIYIGILFFPKISIFLNQKGILNL